MVEEKIPIYQKNNKYGSNGAKIFLLKWGISIKFFKKFYLKSNEKYDKPLSQPKINFIYILKYILNKINYFYIKFFYKKNFRS